MDNIEKQLKTIEEKLDNLNLITVKNGGGRHVSYKRNEFHQMIYDKSSYALWTGKGVKILGAILVLLQVILIINTFYNK